MNKKIIALAVLASLTSGCHDDVDLDGVEKRITENTKAVEKAALGTAIRDTSYQEFLRVTGKMESDDDLYISDKLTAEEIKTLKEFEASIKESLDTFGKYVTAHNIDEALLHCVYDGCLTNEEVATYLTWIDTTYKFANQYKAQVRGVKKELKPLLQNLFTLDSNKINDDNQFVTMLNALPNADAMTTYIALLDAKGALTQNKDEFAVLFGETGAKAVATVNALNSAVKDLTIESNAGFTAAKAGGQDNAKTFIKNMFYAAAAFDENNALIDSKLKKLVDAVIAATADEIVADEAVEAVEAVAKVDPVPAVLYVQADIDNWDVAKQGEAPAVGDVKTPEVVAVAEVVAVEAVEAVEGKAAGFADGKEGELKAAIEEVLKVREGDNALAQEQIDAITASII